MTEESSVFVTKHSVTVRWWRERKSGSADFFEECLRAGRHLSHKRTNIRVDCMEDDGKFRCELSYYYSSRKKRLIEVLLEDKWQIIYLPCSLQDGVKFRIRKRIYLVTFEAVTSRRRVQALLGSDSKEGHQLFYPSGNPVIMQRSHGEDEKAYLWESWSDILIGMEISNFVPVARIIAIDRERVIISHDPSLWV